MGDTVTYEFAKIELQGQPARSDWKVIGEPDAQPQVVAQQYGVKIQSTLDHATRSFEFAVPATATYWVKLSA